MDIRASIKGAGEGTQTHRVLLGKRINPTPYLERGFPWSVTQALLLGQTSQATPTVTPWVPTKAQHPIGRLEVAPFIFSHV